MTKKFYLMFARNMLEPIAFKNESEVIFGNFRKVSSNRTAASSFRSLEI